MNTLLEAVLLGIVCILVGLPVFALVSEASPVRPSSAPGTDRRTLQLTLSLFLTGFLGHLFFEFTGLNPWIHKQTGFWAF